MGSVKILIAEDHPLTIAGLKMLVDTHPQWHNCGQVTDGAEVLAAVADRAPDLLILDIALPHRTGLDLLQELVKSPQRPHTVILSGNTDVASFQRAWDAGADAVVRKNDDPEVIVDAINSVLNGERFIAPTLTKLISCDTTPNEQLTNREIEVLRCMARGHSSKQIGATLSISPGTAKKHRENLMRKLDTATAIAAVEQARRMGLLSLE